MEIESKQQIFERQREIEKELLEMLEETKSDFACPVRSLQMRQSPMGDLLLTGGR